MSCRNCLWFSALEMMKLTTRTTVCITFWNVLFLSFDTSDSWWMMQWKLIKFGISSLFFMSPTSPFSFPLMLGAPSVHTLARPDQLSFFSSKNARNAFRMSSPLVWPTSGSKHSISSWKDFSLGNLTQTHNWATSVRSVLSSTAMLKHGAADTSAQSWSLTSLPMFSIRLIMVESDNCNPLICLIIASLLSNSANNISAEAKKQSFTISESEKVFFPRAKIQAISKDASVKRSAVEVVLCMSLCCSEREEESCSIFLFLSSLPGG